MSENQYNITLSGDFLLTIKNITPPADAEAEVENEREEKSEE